MISVLLGYLANGLFYAFLRRKFDPDNVMDNNLVATGLEVLCWPLFLVWSCIKLVGKCTLKLFELILEIFD